jgi:hypothetical protein
VVVVGIVLPVMLWCLNRTGLAPIAVLRVLSGSAAVAGVTGAAAYLATKVVTNEFARLAIGGSSGVLAGLAVVGIAWRFGRRSTTRAEVHPVEAG